METIFVKNLKKARESWVIFLQENAKTEEEKQVVIGYIAAIDRQLENEKKVAEIKDAKINLDVINKWI